MSYGEFSATHVAPPDGLQAWDAPDPTRTPVAEVQPGVVMQVIERRGAWAHVVFSNGWTGWVDGRRMVETVPAAAPVPAPRPTPAPQPSPQPAPAPAAAIPRAVPETTRPQPQPQPQPARQAPRPAPRAPAAGDDAVLATAQSSSRTGGPRPGGSRNGDTSTTGAARPGVAALLSGVKISPAPIGAIVVFLGGLLPWIRMSGFHGNAFRVPLAFLVDYKTQGGGLKVGLLLVAVAVVSLVFCVLPGRVPVRRILGGVVILAAILYVIQLKRVLSNAGKLAPSLTSVVGLGVLIVVAGGVALIVDKTEPPAR